MTIIHKYLVAVQEDEKEEQEYDDTAEEQGISSAEEQGISSDDKDTEINDKYEGFAFLQDEVLCSIQDKPAKSRSWILLNSQSTVDVFCKSKLLSNIRDTNNARKAIINKKGDLKVYGTVWYYLEGIANILSINNVQKKHKATYNSSQCTGFVAQKADSTRREIMPSSKWLFFSDVKGVMAHVLTNTVEKNKNKYTIKQYSDARKARLIQDIMGDLRNRNTVGLFNLIIIKLYGLSPKF